MDEAKPPNRGDHVVQYSLSIMYANGRGVSQNSVMTYMLEVLAAAQVDEQLVKIVKLAWECYHVSR